MKLVIMNANGLQRIDGKYYSVFSWILFPVRLAVQCEKVTLLAPVIIRNGGAPSPGTWFVDVGRLNIEEQDYFRGFAQYYRHLPFRFRKLKRKVMQLVKEHDAVVVRIPNPMISLLTKCAIVQKRPLVLVFGGDMTAQSNLVHTGCRLKRFLYSIILKVLWLEQNKCARCADMVYVYSNEIARKLELNHENVRLMRTPHMSIDDFKYRDDTCRSHVIRLLRVCWLMPCKGIEYLLEAMAILVGRELPVRLEIAGEENCRGYQKKLQKLTERLGISDRVVFTGWIPFDRMKDVYLRSDIQVISSIAEGTPRCIQEGAAHGLPLVSTTAGGCTDALTHGVDALLVPPTDAKSIADAVAKIIKDGELRRKLIKASYSKASRFTSETAGMQFLNEIRSIVGS